MTEKNREPTPIVGSWRKQKVYRCRLCAFDSTDRTKFEDHFAKAHPPLRVIDGDKADTTGAKSPDPTKGE